VNSRKLSLFVVLGLVVVISGCLGGGTARYNRRHSALTQAELLAAYPWLNQFVPVWQQEVDFANGKVPGYSDLGCFPLGNGRVFAYQGLTYPLGTLDNVIGPEYQKTVGYFGLIVPSVLVKGEPVTWAQQKMRWIKPAGMVATESVTADGLGLTIYDCACPNLTAIIRVMVISNSGPAEHRAVSLAMTVATSNAEQYDDDILIQRGKRRLRCGCLGARTTVTDEQLLPQLPADLPAKTSPRVISGAATSWRCELGTLKPGESVAKLIYLVFSTSEGDEAGVLDKVAARGFGLLDEAHRYYQQWQNSTVQVQCSDERVAHLLDVEKYLCAAQQAYRGGFSPMDGYSYTWIRDSNGPIRYLLACGDFEAVRRHLEYHFRGCAQQQKIGNNLPLDLQLPPELGELDWSQVPVERAEVPSFVILQHYWYYQYTGDSDLINSHWPYLVRCLEGQEIDQRGTLPFHGDETYRFPGYLLFKAGQDAPDYVSLEACSADSAFEYVAAATALAKMAADLGKSDESQEYSAAALRVREATEKLYWQPNKGFYAPAMSDFSPQVHRYPFAPIDMRPLWIGYARADDQQRSNVLNTLKYLGKPEGTVTSTPSFGYYVPMTVGYVLHNLAEIGHPAAQVALDGVLRAAEASGGYAEMNEPNDQPSDEVWGQHRVRPWEGGINAQAILHYLTGFKPDAPHDRVALRPQMPPSWPSLTVTNLRVGDFRLRLELDRQRGRITCQGNGEKNLTLQLTVPLYGELSGLAGTWQQHGGHQQPPFSRYGQHWVTITGIELGPREVVTVIPEYSGEVSLPEPQLPPAVQFDYGLPSIDPGAKVLLLTWSKETVDEYQAEYGSRLAVLDTKMAFPPEFLRAAVLKPDGSRRVDTIIPDISHYPGAFKRPEFWEEGAGGQILAEFQQAGGKVQKPKTVRKMPPSPWGMQQ